MKTIEEIADECSRKLKYESIDDLMANGSRIQIWQVFKSSTEQHAKQVAEAQRLKCTEVFHDNKSTKKSIELELLIHNTPLVTNNI